MNLQFTGDDSSKVAVSDPTLKYLSSAYNIPTSGAAVAPGASNGYFDAGAPRSSLAATFEVVFNVTNTSAGNEQVLMDIGALRGVSMVLNGGVLSAGVNGDALSTTAFSTGPLSLGWHHAVVVIGDTDPNDGSNDEFTLYVDNSVVGSSNTVDIDDYAGSNGWGFGGSPSGAIDPTDGLDQILAAPVDYHGQIALARYYQAAFDSADVAQNYLALQDPTQAVPASTLNVGGDFSTSSLLELDVFQNGTADQILVSGAATLNGAIDVSLVGGSPAIGQAYTILSAVGGITDLGASLMLPVGFTSQIVDGTDLVLTFASAALAGDYNNDGVVDAADYTAWRDNLGQNITLPNETVTPGVVTQEDYAAWRGNYGASLGLVAQGSSSAAPEPSAALLGLMGLLLGAAAGKRRRHSA